MVKILCERTPEVPSFRDSGWKAQKRSQGKVPPLCFVIEILEKVHREQFQ